MIGLVARPRHAHCLPVRSDTELTTPPPPSLVNSTSVRPVLELSESSTKLCGQGPRAEAAVPLPSCWARFFSPTDLTLSCAAGSACRSRSGVTPPRLVRGRQLGCRAEAGPHQLQREVGPRVTHPPRRIRLERLPRAL
jgi:hypothetical protein